MTYMTEKQEARVNRNRNICKMFQQILDENPRMSDRAIILKIKESYCKDMSEVTFRSILGRAKLLKNS